MTPHQCLSRFGCGHTDEVGQEEEEVGGTFSSDERSFNVSFLQSNQNVWELSKSFYGNFNDYT